MITASIVLYKNPLKECYSILDSLIATQIEKIYLVDHSGNDDLFLLGAYSPKIEYIPHENSGYGAGHNVAFEKVYEINPDGFHIVINPDIFITPETIDKLSSFLAENPNIGCCMPKVLNLDGTDQKLCKYLPSPFDLIFRRFLPKPLSQALSKHLLIETPGEDMILSVPWLSGCFMFLRVNAIRMVQGFDERFFMYAEDIDFSRRIHQQFDTYYYPYATIIHAHKAESYHSFKMLSIHISSAIRYFNKWGWFFDKERCILNNQARAWNQLKHINNHQAQRSSVQNILTPSVQIQEGQHM